MSIRKKNLITKLKKKQPKSPPTISQNYEKAQKKKKI
jgi:hypothetical protein